MAILDLKKCSQCNSTVLGKGRERGPYRFCSEKCEKAMALAHAKTQIPPAQVDAEVERIRKSPCPKCKSGVPTDLYFSHLIWSALRFTSRSTRAHLACRACARREQIKALAISAICGWWGIPWGLWTPNYIWRNVQELQKPEGAPEAREALRQSVLTRLGTELLTGPAGRIPGPPIPTPTALNTPAWDPLASSNTAPPTNPMQTHT